MYNARVKNIFQPYNHIISRNQNTFTPTPLHDTRFLTNTSSQNHTQAIIMTDKMTVNEHLKFILLMFCLTVILPCFLALICVIIYALIYCCIHIKWHWNGPFSCGFRVGVHNEKKSCAEMHEILDAKKPASWKSRIAATETKDGLEGV